MRNEIQKGYQKGLLGIVIMSTVPVTIKWVSADPWVIGIARLVIATLVMSFMFPLMSELRGLRGKDYLSLVSLGICFGLHWMTYFFSIKLGSATIAVIATISFYGIFLSLAGSYFLAHRIRWFHWIALSLGVIGTVLVADAFDFGTGALAGFMIGILSGTFYGALPILHQKASHLSHTLRSWAQFAGALPIFLCFAGLGSWNLPQTDWIGLLYLALFGTLVAHTLWVHAVSELPTTASSLIKYLYIPLTAIISYFVLGESLNAQQLVGAVIIVCGSLLGLMGDQLLQRRASTQESSISVQSGS
ncbi:MAG: DMT family transporter [Verrucomicrobiota bacterium]